MYELYKQVDGRITVTWWQNYHWITLECAFWHYNYTFNVDRTAARECITFT